MISINADRLRFFVVYMSRKRFIYKGRYFSRDINWGKCFTSFRPQCKMLGVRHIEKEETDGAEAKTLWV